MNISKPTIGDELSEYTAQIVSSSDEIMEIAQELEHFLLHEAEEHSFQQNPYVILAEHERNPNLIPLIILIRCSLKITCVFFGHITNRPFKLSFSVIQLPAPKLRMLDLHGNGVVFSKKHDKKSCITAFFNTVKLLKPTIELINLNEIEWESPLWQYATENFSSRKTFYRLNAASAKKEILCWHVLHGSHEEWYTSLRHKTRKRISWEKNRFESRAPQPVTIQCIRNQEQVADFIRHIEAIRKDAWQTKTFSTNPHSLADDIKYFEQFALHGWLRSYLLLCGDTPVAYELSVQYRSECIFLERGYAQSFRDLAPGTYLTYFILQHCYNDNPPQKINFGYGENEFKKRLSNLTKDASYAYLTMPNRGRLLVSVQQLLNLCEKGIRNILTKANLDRHVRRLLKRQN